MTLAHDTSLFAIGELAIGTATEITEARPNGTTAIYFLTTDRIVCIEFLQHGVLETGE